MTMFMTKYVTWAKSVVVCLRLSRRGLCRNPRGLFRNEFPDEFGRGYWGGFWGAFLLGNIHPKIHCKFKSEFGSFAAKIHTTRICPSSFLVQKIVGICRHMSQIGPTFSVLSPSLRSLQDFADINRNMINHFVLIQAVLDGVPPTGLQLLR